MIIHEGGPMGYVLISPIKAKFSDDSFSTRLYAKIISDNLVSECVLYWELRDDLGNRTIRDNFTITGDSYSTWSGDSESVFNFILSYRPELVLIE